MASVTVSITASRTADPDPAQEAEELEATQTLVQTLRDDGYSVTGSFYGAGTGTVDLAVVDPAPAADAAEEELAAPAAAENEPAAGSST